MFPAGTVAARPFRRQRLRCFGPGVADMKGGLVLAAMAMEACAARLRPFQELRLLVCADEEVRLRAPAVSAHAAGARAALVFECARENGDVVSARKGAVWRTMELTGRAAHAGADTARGRSAVSALAHEILRIEGLTEGRPEMTSVVTTVAGGAAANTLPGNARATLDIRSSDPGDLDHALVQLGAGGPYDGVTIEIIDRGTWPPMPRNERLTRAAAGACARAGPDGWRAALGRCVRRLLDGRGRHPYAGRAGTGGRPRPHRSRVDRAGDGRATRGAGGAADRAVIQVRQSNPA